MNALNVSARPKARKFVPTPEQAAAMDSTQRSCDWFWSLPPEELRKYCNQTLAIRECQVVATAPTLDELLPKIASMDTSWLYIVSFPLRSRIQVVRP